MKTVRIKAIICVREWFDYNKKFKTFTTTSNMMGFAMTPKVIRLRSIVSGKFSPRYKLYNRSSRGLWYVSESGKTKLHIVNG